MKQMFPILIAIIATTLVMVIVMNKEQTKWSELEKKQKTMRLSLLAVGGVLFLVAVAMQYMLA